MNKMPMQVKIFAALALALATVSLAVLHAAGPAVPLKQLGYRIWSPGDCDSNPCRAFLRGSDSYCG